MTAVTLEVVDARIDWLIHHPATSEWLRQALKAGLAEPVNAANDAELLVLLLRERAEAWSRS